MPNSSTPSTIIQKAPTTVGSTSPFPVGAPAPAPLPVEVVDSTPLILTKFQFRKLFTTAERMTIDNIQWSGSFSASVKAAVATMTKDLDASGEVNLHLADVIQGVTFLYQIGILTSVRRARILANLPPL